MTGPDPLAEHGLLPPPARTPIPGGPQTIVEVLDRVRSEDPGREALVGRHARLSYDELDEAANRAAAALAALGVHPGDRVAASLPNDPEIVVAFLATMRMGAIWVGVNRALAPPEKAYMLADSEVSVILADPDMAAQIEAVRGDLGNLAHIVEVEAGTPGSEWAERLVACDGAVRPAIEVDPYGPAAIAYTSGTTGFPKGAVHSQHNLLVPGAVIASNGTYSPEMRHGVCLPLTILNLIALTPLVAFQVGATCVTMDRIDPVGLATWIRDERIATFSAVPAVLQGLLTHADVHPGDLASLLLPGVGGADFPDAFRALYRERFGTAVSAGYGLTEAPTVVAKEDPGSAHVPGATGRALPHVSVTIRDDRGRVLEVGQIGEVCVGPVHQGRWAGVYTPFLGYWNRPEASYEALRDGVLHTGDMGSLDEHGNLFIRDRKADLIIRGGANVYPAEVERVLHGDPRVVACAVFGLPDERLGERVVGVVQCRAGANVDPEELRRLCDYNLARYKVPDQIMLVDEMPRNAMNKILKPVLRRRWADLSE
ncbi:MAG: class I adenylate-forming enzyme family protein [Acidimicrobiales bacterium]